jgi:hypothetical protein
MKIGIITYHHLPNYGALLQAYALCKVVKNLGHEVEIIDYRPYRAVNYYIKDIFPITISNNIKPNKNFLINALLATKMRIFMSSNLPLSPRTCYQKAELKSNYSNCYDVVICGSDTVWCINPLAHGFDTSFFLDFIDQKSVKKVSYAASFGDMSTLGEYKQKISELIDDFDSIAVRDTHSLNLVKQELDTNKNVHLVLDPTLLITSYDEIIKTPRVNQDYLLIYSRASKKITSKEQGLIKSIANNQGLGKIISTGQSVMIADKNCIGIGPAELLGYYKNTSFVVTNSYHGTIFSIINKKPFIVLYRKGKYNKISDLLNRLDLGNLIIYEEESYDEVIEKTMNIDYDCVYEKLEQEMANSKNYLVKALSYV